MDGRGDSLTVAGRAGGQPGKRTVHGARPGSEIPPPVLQQEAAGVRVKALIATLN